MMIDQIVSATEGRVDLRSARLTCEKIATNEERPGEIFDNLSHMFVILQAIAILREQCSLVPEICAPTQQSEHEGQRIADLQGAGWALEAYGGVDITNNAKLALDLRALSIWRGVSNRIFLAFRWDAYGPVVKMRNGQPRTMMSTCPLKRGGPFSAAATARFIGERNGVVVLEIDTVTISVSKAPLEQTV